MAAGEPQGRLQPRSLLQLVPGASKSMSSIRRVRVSVVRGVSSGSSLYGIEEWFVVEKGGFPQPCDAGSAKSDLSHLTYWTWAGSAAKTLNALHHRRKWAKMRHKPNVDARWADLCESPRWRASQGACHLAERENRDEGAVPRRSMREGLGRNWEQQGACQIGPKTTQMRHQQLGADIRLYISALDEPMA